MKRVGKPWGYYQVLAKGNNFQVKLLHLNPGCRISLQSHKRRVEWFTYVGGSGTAVVGQSAYILLEKYRMMIEVGKGVVHRLEADKKDFLEVIEVQRGDISEDDIKRFEDDYGRTCVKR